MGRFHPTATMQVYQFEATWRQFSKSPRAVTREAFSELVAIAHFHAAAIAHAASSHVFEMIALAMLVGLVRRAEGLQQRGVLLQENMASLQTALKMVMRILRMRLAKQNHELYTFARALRAEDQNTLLALLKAVHDSERGLLVLPSTPHALVSPDDRATNEALLGSLVELMQWIRRLEKQNEGQNAIFGQEEWNRVCCAA